MGRSFVSVRMGVNEIAGRWARVARAMRCGDAVYAEQVVAMTKTYASEAFYAFDDPLEAAIFSVLICMCKEHRPDDEPVVTGGSPPFQELPSLLPTANQPRKQGNRQV